VRKTGVMGILKLYHLAPELVKGSNMVDLLYNMIQDPDVHVRASVSGGGGIERWWQPGSQAARYMPAAASLIFHVCAHHTTPHTTPRWSVEHTHTHTHTHTRARAQQVITNCVIVLNELLAEEGGMAVNQPLILHLLARVGEFTEWGLTHVLALVAKYAPADEEELFSIMNLLDPVLRTSNSGVVLATIKCFLHLTTAIPELQPQVGWDWLGINLYIYIYIYIYIYLCLCVYACAKAGGWVLRQPTNQPTNQPPLPLPPATGVRACQGAAADADGGGQP
jgi:hypothetical protein